MSLAAARALRASAHGDLAALSGVVGTAVGFKRTGGRRTRTPSVVVYVRKKLPADQLVAAHSVPADLPTDSGPIHTDVVELAELEYQFGPAPWFCRDRRDNQGTVTTLCRPFNGGPPAGLTCAHCIGGADSDPSSPDPITVYDPVDRQYREVGPSGPYSRNNGFGLPGNFGFTDWGLFDVEGDPDMVEAGLTAPPLSVQSPWPNARVTTRSAHGALLGSIDQIDAQFGDLYADLVIRLDRGRVFRGDSGALWRAADGSALAIHAIGEKHPQGSPISICMSAERISGHLGQIGQMLLDC